MHRLALICLLSWLTIGPAFAQTKKIDSLRAVLAKHPQQDTFRVNRLNELILAIGFSVRGKDARVEQLCRSVAQQAISLAKRLNYNDGQAYALLNLYKSTDSENQLFLLQALELAKRGQNRLLQWDLFIGVGYTYRNEKQAAPYFESALALAEQMGLESKRLESLMYAGNYYSGNSNYPKALTYFIDALQGRTKVGNQLEKLPNDPAFALLNQAGMCTVIAQTYLSLTDYESALAYLTKAQRFARLSKSRNPPQKILLTMGDCYRLMGQYPKAIATYQKLLKDSIDNYYLRLDGLTSLADVYERTGNLPLAFGSAFQMITVGKQIPTSYATERLYVILCRAYQQRNQPDSALYYGHQALKIAQKYQEKEVIRDASQALARLYWQRHAYEKAYTYQSRFVGLKDSLNNEEVTRKATALRFTEQMNLQQSQIILLTKDKQLQAEEARRQRQLLYTSLIVLALIGGMLALLYRNNRQQQRANALLQQQKQEIQHQRDQTQQALTELKVTQQQLIQKEKMASLGELTAGIAHEIQNPLNFVNNFSEVSAEMVEELAEERQKPQRDIDLETELLTDLKDNLTKINHHGQRASNIVKGMLAHSRSSTSEMHPTDLNALCDEYLRLAYHGQRAKDKDFNCELVTEFDPMVGKVNVMSQEMSRVLLNLFTNAFYAVRERQKQAEPDYQPRVRVSTRQTQRGLDIRVSDNGTGMTESVKAKIFQPFFTTKPTGEGTGLGLSLSYDIVTKGHGGSLTVDSQPEQGTLFVIYLPLAIHQ